MLENSQPKKTNFFWISNIIEFNSLVKQEKIQEMIKVHWSYPKYFYNDISEPKANYIFVSINNYKCPNIPQQNDPSLASAWKVRATV